MVSHECQNLQLSLLLLNVDLCVFVTICGLVCLRLCPQGYLCVVFSLSGVSVLLYCEFPVSQGNLHVHAYLKHNTHTHTNIYSHAYIFMLTNVHMCLCARSYCLRCSGESGGSWLHPFMLPSGHGIGRAENFTSCWTCECTLNWLCE